MKKRKNKKTKEQKNEGIKKRRNKRTKEQKNERTKNERTKEEAVPQSGIEQQTVACGGRSERYRSLRHAVRTREAVGGVRVVAREEMACELHSVQPRMSKKRENEIGTLCFKAKSYNHITTESYNPTAIRPHNHTTTQLTIAQTNQAAQQATK